MMENSEPKSLHNPNVEAILKLADLPLQLASDKLRLGVSESVI